METYVLTPLAGHYFESLQLVGENLQADLKFDPHEVECFVLAMAVHIGCWSMEDNRCGFLVGVQPGDNDVEPMLMVVDNPLQPHRFFLVSFTGGDNEKPEGATEWVPAATFLLAQGREFWKDHAAELEDLEPEEVIAALELALFSEQAPWGEHIFVKNQAIITFDEVEDMNLLAARKITCMDGSTVYLTPEGVTEEEPKVEQPEVFAEQQNDMPSVMLH